MAESGWDSAPERFALAPIYHVVAEAIGWDAALDFGLAVWQEKRPPSRASSGGRGVIYIPRQLDGRLAKDLVRLAGPENAALLIKRFQGASLEFPNIVPASIGRRNRAIIESLREGQRPTVVACAFGLTDRQIRRISNRERS